MSEIKWIKITTNMFDDEKIRLIEMLPDADAVLVIWIKLLMLAGRCNDKGLVYLHEEMPYDAQMLSTIMRKPVATIQLALNEFQNLKMIEIHQCGIEIINWEKHQNIEGMEKIKEQTKKRVQKYRENKKLELGLAGNKSDNNECNVTVTLSNATEENRIDKNRIDKESKRKKFKKPSRDEVKDYLSEIQKNIDIDKFFDYYESKGWKVGNAPMKDWKATVRNWARREKEFTPQNKSGNKFIDSLPSDTLEQMSIYGETKRLKE